VYEQLYGAMLDGRLQPGDRLSPWFEAIAKADVPAERPAAAFRGPSVSLKQPRRTKSPSRKRRG